MRSKRRILHAGGREMEKRDYPEGREDSIYIHNKVLSTTLYLLKIIRVILYIVLADILA